MKYARYFCGQHDGTVISEEEYYARGEAEAQASDTINYEPVFDGRIYPTVAESTAAQIATYGCQYKDARGINHFKDISTETLQKMSKEAFSAYYREATKQVDYQPGMKFPELEKATNRLNEINEEIERRLNFSNENNVLPEAAATVTRYMVDVIDRDDGYKQRVFIYADSDDEMKNKFYRQYDPDKWALGGWEVQSVPARYKEADQVTDNSIGFKKRRIVSLDEKIKSAESRVVRDDGHGTNNEKYLK